VISTTKLEERKPVASTNEHAKPPKVQHTQSDGRYSHSRHARSSFLPSSERVGPSIQSQVLKFHSYTQFRGVSKSRGGQLLWLQHQGRAGADWGSCGCRPAVAGCWHGDNGGPCLPKTVLHGALELELIQSGRT
jgi:hypothetical protein